jgi:fructose/tagatose bisphosphate aldolase
VPLVLHGGSGIRQEYIRAAIGAGIAKINVGTDLRQPYERALAEGGAAEEARAAVAAATRRQICEVFDIEGSAARLRAEAERLGASPQDGAGASS